MAGRSSSAIGVLFKCDCAVRCSLIACFYQRNRLLPSDNSRKVACSSRSVTSSDLFRQVVQIVVSRELVYIDRVKLVWDCLFLGSINLNSDHRRVVYWGGAMHVERKARALLAYPPRDDVRADR
jgi:hypothetical protein